MNKYKTAFAVITIAAAGVLTGLLIAPQKGSKLRKKLKKKTVRGIQNLSGIFSSGENSGTAGKDSTHEVAL